MNKDKLKEMVDTIEKATRVFHQLEKEKKKVPGVVEAIHEIMKGLETMLKTDDEIKIVVGSLIGRVNDLEAKNVKKGGKDAK